MYQILTIFLFCIFSYLGVSAQDFAPIGAKWTYEVVNSGYSFPANAGVYSTEVISQKDTIVNGRNCRFLEALGPIQACRSFYPIVTSSPNQDTVFFYDAQKDTFQVLYNFNSNVGDSWKIYLTVMFQEYEITTTILTKNTVNQNGNILRKYTCNYHIDRFQTFQFNIEAEIVEFIGDIIFPYQFANHTVGCEDDWLKELRCYSDNVIGDVKLSTVDCNYNNISTKEEQKFAFSLFPNPTADFIHLQLENTENVNYRITDITGKTVLQNTWNGQSISVESLNSGVYFITIFLKNEILGTQKLIKK